MRLKEPDMSCERLSECTESEPEDHRERRFLASVQLLVRRPDDALATLVPPLQASDAADTLELASTSSLKKSLRNVLPTARPTLITTSTKRTCCTVPYLCS
jgi:thioredoxin-like negative regulator of GroEL